MTGRARPFADHGILWQESKLPKQPECSDRRESPVLPVLEHLEKIYHQYRHSPPFHAVPIMLFASLKDLHYECSFGQFLNFVASCNFLVGSYILRVFETFSSSGVHIECAGSSNSNTVRHVVQNCGFNFDFMFISSSFQFLLSRATFWPVIHFTCFRDIFKFWSSY